MSTTLKIPMNEETRISLEDVFIDTPNMDARKFVFDGIKSACQDAKRSLRNKVTPVNKRPIIGGQPKQEEFSLKGIDLSKYTLVSNPSWLPKNLDVEDNAPLELKLLENTMYYLKAFGQITCIRHEQFNKAEDEFIEATHERMVAEGTPEESITQWQKAQEPIKEQRLEAIPECLEEAIFNAIWPILQQEIDQNDQKVFDREYAETYKDSEPKPDSPQ